MAFYLIDYENVKNIHGTDALSSDDTLIFFYSQSAASLSFDMHMALEKCEAKKEYFKAHSGGKNALDFQLSSYAGYLAGKDENADIYVITHDKGYEKLISFWAERGCDRIRIAADINRIASGLKQDLKRDVHAEEKDAAEPVTVQDTEVANAPCDSASEGASSVASPDEAIEMGGADTAAQADEPKQEKKTKKKPAKKAAKTQPEAVNADAATDPSQISAALKNHAKDIKLNDHQITRIVDIFGQYKTRMAINNNMQKAFKDNEQVKKINKVLKPFLKHKN